MAARVYVHVGLPKSGTTFLQTSLRENRKALKAAGVLYPGGHERMFLAAVDVRGSHKGWGRTREEVTGAWDELCRKARAYDGRTVISHELLAAATPRQITGAMSMLKGLDVHVVVTARDPARQAVAEWQEGVKHGRRLTFAEFRARVLEDSGTDPDYAQRYRANQDLPAVLARWGKRLPPDRVHVVTCPPPSAEPGVLWQRFAGVVGFDPDRFQVAGPGSANTSLGVHEIDLLRRVNLALDGRLRQPGYGKVVKQLYAQRLLAAHDSPRPVVPAEMYDDLAVVAERWVKEIDKAGYAVHGDLDELVPVAAASSTERSSQPDRVDPAAQVDVAAAATAELLLELAAARAQVADLEGSVETHKRKRKLLKRRLRKAKAS